MKIKVCGLSSEDNIKEVVGLEPDLIGFIFYPPSPRYVVDKVDPLKLTGLGDNVLKTGVFVNADFYEISGIFWKYNLDIVQLHGDESPALCEQLKDTGIKTIKAFSLHEEFDFEIMMDYIPYCKYFLFDTQTKYRGGSGKKFNWEIIRKYELGHPFFLSGGIAPGDAREILSITHPSLAGVDVNSRFEKSPGIKDIGKLKQFFNDLKK